MQLPIGDVRKRADLQLRAAGVTIEHARQLGRVLTSGGDLEPVKVAKIGKAFYLVDGFHRLEAMERAGTDTISAMVATMSLEDARDYALLANTKHGKRLSPADKAAILSRYVERGKHLDGSGGVKSSRRIAAEIANVYSHETVRKKLPGMGVEVDEAVEFPGGKKPWMGRGDEALAVELAEEAREHLSDFASLFFSLEDGDQREMLAAARGLVASLERGERPVKALAAETFCPLDI